LILSPAIRMFSEPDDASSALTMGAGWLLNPSVAEWLIRAPTRH